MRRISKLTLAGISAAGALLLLVGTASANFTTIIIDGDFSDWAGVPILDSDDADNAGSVDLADIQIANDDDNLYLRATYHGALAQSTFIALDIDENLATGFDIFTLGVFGSEAGWQNDFGFQQASGGFNVGPLAGDNFGGGHALMSPFGDSSSREWSISLAATIAAGGDLFPDDSFNIMLYTDAGAGDISASIPYTLMVIPEPATAGLLALGGLAIVARRRRHQ